MIKRKIFKNSQRKKIHYIQRNKDNRDSGATCLKNGKKIVKLKFYSKNIFHKQRLKTVYKS